MCSFPVSITEELQFACEQRRPEAISRPRSLCPQLVMAQYRGAALAPRHCPAVRAASWGGSGVARACFRYPLAAPHRQGISSLPPPERRPAPVLIVSASSIPFFAPAQRDRASSPL